MLRLAIFMPLTQVLENYQMIYKFYSCSSYVTNHLFYCQCTMVENSADA